MKTIRLEVQTRDTALTAKVLRRQNLIPAVYYGQGEKSQPISMDYQTFRKVFRQTGQSQLIDLSVDGKDVKKVLVHDYQQHPLMDTIEHVDFLLVSLKEEITASVPVNIIGESLAVKDLGGILNTVKHELSVKCLPLELPHDIEVDISVLLELHSSIHVSDLIPPKGVTFLDGEEDVVVIVNAPRVEEEEPVVAEGEGGEEGEDGGEEGEDGGGEGEEGGGEGEEKKK